MKRLASSLLILWGMLGCPPGVWADNNVVAPFLQEGLGGRGVGMGENFAAVAEGPFGWHYNPAGLAMARNAAVGYQHEALSDLVQHNVFAGSLPLGSGSLAALINFFNYGSIDEVDTSGQRTGSVLTPQDGSFFLGYGMAVSDAWGIGANVGYFNEALGPSSVSGLTVDLGGKWDLAPDWSLAGVIKNLGGKPQGYSLPGTMLLAGSYRPFPDWLLLDMELALPMYSGFTDLGLGAEFKPWQWLDLRLGFKVPLRSLEGAAMNGLVFGAGFWMGGFCLDLALASKGDMGSKLSLALGYTFGRSTQPATAAAQPPQKAVPAESTGHIPVTTGTDQAAFHFKAGQEYERYDQLIDAIVEYKAALQLRPNYPEALKALAAVKNKAKNQAEADQAESQAAKATGQPESLQKLIRKYYHEGEIAYQQKDYTTAVQKLQLVMEMTTQHRQATELLEKARAALNSEMASLRRQAAQAEENGDLAGQVEAHEKMLDLRPEDKQIKAKLEALKVRIPQEAERLYKTGVEYYARREYRKALSVFEKLLTLQPDHVKARDALNNTKEKLIQTGQ
ncbi:MAG: hypothetical protein AB1439_09970 [candidate division FCPU426 bacterium]